MRRCIRCTWTCPLILENHHIIWRCLLFIKAHVLCFVCIYMKANATCCLLQTVQQRLSLGRHICKNLYVICIICIRKSMSRVLSASCFFRVKPFSFIRSIDVRSRQWRQIMNRYEADVSPRRTPGTMSKKSVSPSCVRTLTFLVLQRIILWPWQFLWGDHTLLGFAPSLLCYQRNRST